MDISASRTNQAGGRSAAAPVLANLAGAHASQRCLDCGASTTVGMCMSCWSLNLGPMDGAGGAASETRLIEASGPSPA